jgi:hypothetical protein
MPEFLKHLIVLGMASMLTLSRGYDAQPSAVVPAVAEAVVTTVEQGETLSAAVAIESYSIQPPAKPSARTGVTVVQSSPDAPTLAEAGTLAATPTQPRPDVIAHNPVPTDKPAVLAAPAPETTCRAMQPQGYGSLSIRGGATDHPASGQADLNLGQRAWRPVNAPLAFQSIGGPTDGNAPRFSSLFAPSRIPRMTGAYQVFNWDFRTGRRTSPVTSPAVTLVGFATVSGEPILLPGSGYSIGDGYAALVLYAEPSRVTLKYTREDNVAVGYTLHLENLCVEPHLLALYHYLNGAGRRQLPALRNGQPLGTANGTQILAGIQDSGAWMDPRSRKDWWQ